VAERLAIRLPNWLGDAVMAEPVVHAARARASRDGGSLRLIAPRKLLELWPASGDDVALDTRGAERAAHYQGCDAALLLNGSLRSAWCAARARVPRRAGFARGARRLLLTHAFGPALERGGLPPGRGVRGGFPRALPRPFGAACRELAAALGVSVSEPRARLAPDALALERVRARLAAEARDGFWLVHAGARPGSAKGLPAESWPALLAALRAGGAPALVCAPGPGEEDAALRAAAAAAPATLGGLQVLAEPALSVAELVALSALAQCVVTPDNGARHVAAALGRPTLVLCGPTDPRHTAEHAPATRVLRTEVECGPCHRERCPRPEPARHLCWTRLDLDAVARAALELAPPRDTALRPGARSG